MNINICSEEIVKEVEHTNDFSSEEVQPSSITTDYAVSVNAEKTNFQIENTLSSSIVVSEAIDNEQVSNISQNLFPSNRIDVIKEDENKDDEDKRGASVIPKVSTGVKMIGSLGLLSQYASSSYESDDTEDEDKKSDGTKSSHDSEKIKSKADSFSKSILDNAISQGGYRGVNVDTYVCIY